MSCSTVKINRDWVSKCSVHFLIKFPRSVITIYCDELQGQLKSYPVAPTIYKKGRFRKTHTGYKDRVNSSACLCKLERKEKKKSATFLIPIFRKATISYSLQRKMSSQPLRHTATHTSLENFSDL